VKRMRLPRHRSNDGKTLVAVDLTEIQHKPMPARSSGGDHAVTGTVVHTHGADRGAAGTACHARREFAGPPG
jgi:hypothetical protein